MRTILFQTKLFLIIIILLPILISCSLNKSELLMTYSNWNFDLNIGEVREVCLERDSCKSCYDEYRNLLSYDDRCCNEFGCVTPCGPFPEIEKENAEADLILCVCETNNNDTTVIKHLLFELNITDRSLFKNNDSCKPEKKYAI
ncbi:hypothetical protein HQ533_00920 [Candidatus Woesearchaeota archaeon]|nr:hypothetical protein [Candidatus Woesearchaeota archaeon]